jgi:hypothetical protein
MRYIAMIKNTVPIVTSKPSRIFFDVSFSM